MKKNSEDIECQIRVFYASLPGLRSSIEMFPTIDIDQNYVSNLLNNKLEEMIEKRGKNLDKMVTVIDSMCCFVQNAKQKLGY